MAYNVKVLLSHFDIKELKEYISTGILAHQLLFLYIKIALPKQNCAILNVRLASNNIQS